MILSLLIFLAVIKFVKKACKSFKNGERWNERQVVNGESRLSIICRSNIQQV